MNSSVRYIEARSILSRLRQPDPYFGIAYNMNLYRGCQHGCIYCDTRSECYGIGDISQITVKKNALELLARELNSRLKNKATIGTGSMNDPYMPIEQELQLTRQALKIVAGKRFPLHIITKSSLVTRDKDLLQEISKTYAAVSITLTTADDDLVSRIEPHASSSSQRLLALRTLSDAGIYTGVTLMPTLPFINDSPEGLSTLLRKIADSGARYVLYMPGMTLRKGSREYFYGKIEKLFPGVRQQYEATFADRYVCDSLQRDQLLETFYRETNCLGLATRMLFYQPEASQQLSLF